jgi:hypothetical protein
MLTLAERAEGINQISMEYQIAEAVLELAHVLLLPGQLRALGDTQQARGSSPRPSSAESDEQGLAEARAGSPASSAEA